MTRHSEVHAAFRIIDANANRSLEGLRVVEDFMRFALNDRHLAGKYKDLRHELAALLAQLPEAALTAARDTPGDIGTGIAAPGEYVRETLADVAVASQKRAEQALRCIEEYAKTVVTELARQIEQLRYRLYTLGKAWSATLTARNALAGKQLYVLLEGGPSLEMFAKLAGEMTEAGVDVIQLRDKRLSDRELVARGHVLREITSATNTLFIVNDRPDLAVIVRADGVHVGQDEASVADARLVLGPERLVGVSTHSVEQARQAVLDGADYIGCGPTFPSRTKEFHEFPGLALLRSVAAEIRLPAFAIGGITLDTLPAVLGTGFERVAVGNCVAAADDPRAAIEQLKELLATATVTTSAKS